MPRTDLQKAQVLLLKAEKELLKIGKDFTNSGSINKKILFSVSALVSTAGILASKSLNSPAPTEYSAEIQSALNSVAASADTSKALVNAADVISNAHASVADMAIEAGMRLMDQAHGVPKHSVLEAMKSLLGLG